MANVTPPTNGQERGGARRRRGPGMPPTEPFDPRLLLRALTAFRRGDFTVRLPDEWTGLGGKIADAFNDVIDLNRRMARELDRLSRVVGKQGKIAERGTLGDAPGEWGSAMGCVNALIADLAYPLSETSRVIGAVAKGDLSQAMAVQMDGRELEGEFLRTARTVNTMVEQLGSFASEVTRVAREVGTEGKLGGQAKVKAVAGTWKDLTDSVNSMASNLTAQVRNIAAVTTAVAGGDLSKKITVDVKGEILELKDTINTMVDQLRSFASEVTRVAREVGTEGELGGQADVKGVAGTWKDLTDSVNSMASNLTGQVRNIAEVTTAVANGDLSKKITVDVRGEIAELKNTVNTMVDQLNSFASEVTRVAREVGTEGKLGGQADVKGVAGTWKDLTDSVNSMASNLTGQVRNIAAVTIAVAGGDLSKKITVDVRGEILELKDTINTMVDQLRAFAAEVTRLGREVGTEGKLGGQAVVPGVAGVWKDLTDSVNFMASNLTTQVRNIADVTKAVAAGDLTRKITVDVKGEILDLKNTVNTMVDQLSSFASEVTRVAREVGTEGKLGGQAVVRGVSGTWKDLTDNVNFMAANLTDQVRGIARVVTAVANGDLKKQLMLEAKGEIAALADTINSMIETLATFADQVTTVAREVGVEGKLGGQASVPGAAGTWRRLTDNVNQLAANLTTQVRAIAEVATAVTKGDLTRSIQVEALGEVASLKDNINEMIRNLRETTQINAEQDWLKTNLAKFTRMLQGQKDLLTVGRLILSELAPVVSAQHGVFYTVRAAGGGPPRLRLLAGYAFKERKNVASEFGLGEGLVGQAALEKERILLTRVPPDYVQISSGLGQATPLNIIVLPIVFEGEVKAVMELASFERFTKAHLAFLDQLMESIGIVLNTIEANSRTEELLEQSQGLARELQSQQEELQQTNEELEEKAKLLATQNVEVERKNKEVEQARRALEEKAEQLALTSKYKSEFLANMSHELRTPLNSLLILANQLADNPDGNLTPRQTEFARTIHGSGRDLLVLINDILDLSKIESGTVTVDVGDVSFADLAEYVERTFRHVAESRSLAFKLDMDPGLPKAMQTDAQRLQQVLKNLLANAFKFTDKGEVTLRIRPATGGWAPEHPVLSRARSVVAFEVSDTGIGIAGDKQQVIFEAFHQAMGGTGRKYGGTGLGLAISREISRLLGGELTLEKSAPGEGSTFVLYVPQSYAAPSRPRSQASSASSAGSPAPGGGAQKPPALTPAVTRSEIVLAPPEPSPTEDIQDDGEDIRPGDRVLLVVEDDLAFSRFLYDLAHEKGFKAVVTSRGARALVLARELKPSAITLDISLPDVDGWRVLERLKEDAATRHIPVYFISVAEEPERALQQGALGFLHKPADREALAGAFDTVREFVDRRVKKLLVLEDDEIQRNSILELIGNRDVSSVAVATGEEALAALEREHYDCMVLDLLLPDMPGLELLQRIKKQPRLRSLPIIVYTGKDLSREEERELKRLAQTIILKDVRSPERLLDETALFLHRNAATMPESKRQIIDTLHQSDTLLAGKKVLLVDDDVRNIFAMTSILERHQMEVLPAESGPDAVKLLERHPDVNVVLMDIMLPEMDGYETTRTIRRRPRFRDLPIIALTAKAMKGDREKCLEAGASDYIAKPVDTEQLLSLLRVWLYR
jgi:CheY-like chemotaxis protein/HAMP domain-containing protein/signal transduction histidine kinase